MLKCASAYTVSIIIMSVDLTHYSLPLVQIHTHQMCISGVLWTAGTGRGHTWPSLSNVPCTTSTHITSINLSGGQQHRVCWSCVSGLEVVLISSGVDMFLGAEKLNSSSADHETDNTPITTLLNIGVAGSPAGAALAGPLFAQETNFLKSKAGQFAHISRLRGGPTINQQLDSSFGKLT